VPRLSFLYAGEYVRFINIDNYDLQCQNQSSPRIVIFIILYVFLFYSIMIIFNILLQHYYFIY